MDQTEALKQLLVESGRGDERAFARLYELTCARLYATALRLLRRADWAEEVLQESYVSVWNHAANYQPALSAPTTWMISIVRNRCLDWLRRPKLEVGDEDEELMLSIASDDPGPLEQLEASTEARALAECLKRLEDKQRDAIMLAFFEGLSHSELAQRLSLPLGTVKSWVRRGMERLKTCLST